jgi:MoaA/NifB/PqqE/SkfB family radical SAM enzyme
LSVIGRTVKISDAVINSELAKSQEIELNRPESIVSYFPKDLSIETTTECNLNCVMCWRAVGAIPDPKHLPTKQLDQWVPYLRQAEFIQLHGNGEPLLSPAFWRALELIGKDSRETKCVSINTNGLLLNKDNIERLIDSPLHNINVSLDAATPDTYRRIRGADFSVVLNNIRNFVRVRDQLGAKAPLLYLNMTLMRANIEELPLFIELVSQLKGDRAYFWHMSDALDHENVAWRIERDGWIFDYQEQLTSRYPGLTNRMVHLALNRASELGVSVETGVRNQLWLPEDSQSKQASNDPAHSTECVASGTGDSQVCLENSGCDAPWRWLVIHVDGAVRACCYMQQAVGDWHRESIEKIWNGKIMQEVRIAVRERRVHTACKGAVCRYSSALEAR